ncbi:glycosyltransferase [Oxalicibacterium solurbis]|uniref:Glycosyltransferase 2-like domain-containing protein n=1 Tax=Oxalicibacterium solurbis TaxID=69280 RepID=A0A8J3F5U9_9BURK|nr:glycosyltransferase [Oxalicibacterium solurbis]GGI54439.1 hypothetical protein GCM10011430_16130 [Oxalicibacterium solurbis]
MKKILSVNATPRISIVTVTRNDAVGLTETIHSVLEQDYENLQFVVVDGASTDRSVDVLESKKNEIDVVLIEPDIGIYHAMNKAIDLADGEWLLFMNAGDVFFNKGSLSSAAAKILDDIDVVYADWIYRDSGFRVQANLKKLNVRHQSVLYRKDLHSLYGNYVVGKGVSISDYIFFLSISEKKWIYSQEPLSICNQDGVSARPSHLYQRIASEIIYGRRSRVDGAFILFAYPMYRFLKKRIFFPLISLMKRRNRS